MNQVLTIHAPTESISKIVMTVNDSIRIKLRVQLAQRGLDGSRQKFVRNYEYEPARYKNIGKVSALQVETEDYLIIENYLNWKDKNRDNNFEIKQKGFKTRDMWFSTDNIGLLYNALTVAWSWFQPESGVWLESNGEIKGINPKHANLVCECTSNHFIKYHDGLMRMSPTVGIDKSQTRSKKITITMGRDAFVLGSVSEVELWSWIYFLQHFDLCTASMILTNQALQLTNMRNMNTQK